MERLAERRPDVILLDFMMPVMNGTATLRAIAANPELRGIPVIVMSSMPESRVAGKQAAIALSSLSPSPPFAC
jgi:CheY-like chemotaxis protein